MLLPLIRSWQAINHRLVQDSAKAQQAQLEKLKEELEALAQRSSQDAREKSERILNASLAVGRQVTAQLMEEGARTSARLLADEMTGLLDRLALPVREARQVAVFNSPLRVSLLLAAAVALWVTLR